MQLSAPFFRERKVELAERLDAQFRSIVFAEELGDGTLGAIKGD